MGGFLRPAGRIGGMVLTAILAGCSGGEGGGSSPTPAPAVSISVSPADATLAAGASQTFSAAVTGTTDAAVVWSVREGSVGGSITSAGSYTAPNTPGTYHVVATSQADPGQTAVATITVEATGTDSGDAAITVQ